MPIYLHIYIQTRTFLPPSSSPLTSPSPDSYVSTIIYQPIYIHHNPYNLLLSTNLSSFTITSLIPIYLSIIIYYYLPTSSLPSPLPTYLPLYLDSSSTIIYLHIYLHHHHHLLSSAYLPTFTITNLSTPLFRLIALKNIFSKQLPKMPKEYMYVHRWIDR